MLEYNLKQKVRPVNCQIEVRTTIFATHYYAVQISNESRQDVQLKDSSANIDQRIAFAVEWSISILELFKWITDGRSTAKVGHLNEYLGQVGVGEIQHSELDKGRGAWRWTAHRSHR
eukprot:scaffold28207_cov80-Cyclotella_meneghiniana.AAC.1